ncbi:MAG: winged helix-turn-helix domain-containing protein [Oscillospiraceae bacterium]|jgi:DNA-binding SARP family transcriptional activator|nr:winged helix-turn-helix domain-containing protein [Oscillospiraceae bacterium]
MDTFTIYIGENKAVQWISKSRKGAALMQYLILNQGQPVPNYRLLSTLWPEEKSSNPENALKTLVSRLRALMNQSLPGLGQCIVADRGAYHWQTLPGMTIDIYEIEQIFERLAEPKLDKQTRRKLSGRLMMLYAGDLLQNSEQNEWALARATMLHGKYMQAVYAYVDMLKADKNLTEIINVCRTALDVDNFDDRLHIELMSALIESSRANEALVQYKHVMHLYHRYLGIRPSDELHQFYKQIMRAGKALEFNLESIRNDLRECGDQRDAFVCEYAVFKEIYNLQMRNLERLGATMFLAVIMVSSESGEPMDLLRQDNIMQGLLEILKQHLRRGDTITHFSPTQYALLLSSVNYTTGNTVMERLKRVFYQRYPNSNVLFNYRVGSIIGEDEDSDRTR